MANKAFPTIPGTIEIPSGVEDFKTRNGRLYGLLQTGRKSSFGQHKLRSCSRTNLGKRRKL